MTKRRKSRVLMWGKPLWSIHTPLVCLAGGFASLGYDVEWRNPSAFSPDDNEACEAVAVLGTKDMNGEVLKHFVNRGIPALAVEFGYINRPAEQSYADPEAYYQIGLNGLCWLPPGPMPSDRFEALNVTVEPWHLFRPGPVLVCGQVPNDGQHGLNKHQMLTWLSDAVKDVKSRGLKTVWRPHPKGTDVANPGCEEVQDSGVPLDEALDHCSAVLSYNSTVGQAALLRGIPVMASRAAMYSELATLPCEVKYKHKDRAPYFNRLAYAQWKLDEMKSGEAVKFMMEQANG